MPFGFELNRVLRSFEVISEPYSGARPSVHLCVGPELSRCVHIVSKRTPKTPIENVSLLANLKTFVTDYNGKFAHSLSAQPPEITASFLTRILTLLTSTFFTPA